MLYTKSIRLFHISIILLVVIPLNQAFAGLYSDELGKKLVESTTQEEKAILVRWMFVAMSSHPDLKDMSSITNDQREEANRAFANLVVRMLTVTCVTEAKKAVKYEGSSAIESAFNMFGQVAGRELFTNPEVGKSLSDLEKYVDKDAMTSVFGDESKGKK